MVVNKLYGRELVSDFGPVKLQAIQPDGPRLLVDVILVDWEPSFRRIAPFPAVGPLYDSVDAWGQQRCDLAT